MNPLKNSALFIHLFIHIFQHELEIRYLVDNTGMLSVIKLILVMLTIIIAITIIFLIAFSVTGAGLSIRNVFSHSTPTNSTYYLHLWLKKLRQKEVE